jgi:hypothetical protein
VDTVRIAPGAWIDMLGGAAQIALAVYLLRSRRGAAVVGFAVFFALNGFAFLLGNIVPRSHPMFPLLRLTLWGTLNWMALGSVLVTAAHVATWSGRR